MHYIETISLEFKEAVLFPPMESHGPRAFGVGVIVPTPLKPCHHPSEPFPFPYSSPLPPHSLPTPNTPHPPLLNNMIPPNIPSWGAIH